MCSGFPHLGVAIPCGKIPTAFLSSWRNTRFRVDKKLSAGIELDLLRVVYSCTYSAWTCSKVAIYSFVDDQCTHCCSDYLPLFFNLYTTYYTPYQPYIRPFMRYVYYAQSYAYKYLFPTLWPLYRLTRMVFSRLSDAPDIVTVVVLVLVAWISLRVLDILRRQIVYWISVALKLLLWAAVALIGFYVYQRGVEQSLEDFGWVLGYFAGLENEGERLGQTKGKAKMNQARKSERGAPRGRTRGGGWL